MMKITIVCPICFCDIVYDESNPITIDVNRFGGGLTCCHCNNEFIIFSSAKKDFENIRYKAVYSNE